MGNKPSYEELLSQISALKKQTKYLAEKVDKLEKINQHYLEQLRLSKKKIFGASSEQIADVYEQLNLFNEAESERTPLLSEPKIEEVIVPSHKRKKKRTFEEKYSDLLIDEVVYGISDEEKVCEKCGSELTLMKYETRRELKIIPAQVKLLSIKKLFVSAKAAIETFDCIIKK